MDISTIKADIDSCQHRIRTLQHSTIECIAFKPSGKIEVVDKERLEALNTEIDGLTSLAGHNSEVLERLRAALKTHSSIEDAERAKHTADERLYRFNAIIRTTAANWLKQAPSYTPETIAEHPAVKKVIAEYRPMIEAEEKGLQSIKEILEAARVIAGEFKPSGLPEIKQKRSGGMVRFDIPAKAVI